MAERLRVAVCDDDEAALGIISSSLKDVFAAHGIDATTSLFPSAQELSQAMPTRRYDLLLLDIDMPGLDGITFAKQLREQCDRVDIMYISNREDKVFDSLRVSPVGFIRKSRFLSDMSEVVGTYLEQRRGRHSQSTVMLRDSDAVYPVRVDQISYIEGQRKYQAVHVEGRNSPIVLRRTMGELERDLADEGFIRIHKGYLVNYRFIEVVGSGEVRLTNGEALPVSRRKENETREKLLEFVQDNDRIVF
ncbi:LytTR family DNA-binding domain-containing protein [Paratractidigestivibacter sp.]|uniref:LytR/AlgR family response regulator transcription factor n=1 Tax=Paratractidigestivibacter sp. TaxID=2847316 RepID=UPI002AC99AA6|nr:LytTR family DNA-binding domain-containing protein [Paratractidigestivibacter sp.]